MEKNLERVQKILIYVALGCVALIAIFPFAYALYTSFLPLEYVDKIAPLSVWSFDNYKYLWDNYPIGNWYMNTIIMAGITLLGNIVTSTMAGYALARFKFKGKKAIFMIVLLSMMIPFQLIITPLYSMVVKLNWHNTMTGLTVPFLVNCLYIFMARQFFLELPKELEEAAKIDGLGRFGTFLRIALPLSGPAMVTITIFNFTTSWNAYLVPATFTTATKNFTLVVGLNTVKDLMFDRTNHTMAGVVMLSLPILLLFLLMQKYFVASTMSSGIKG